MSAPCVLERRITDAWPPSSWSDVTVLVAVSGGADSVALLRALNAIRTGGAGRLIVAHFNHRLRGEQSDRDESFVERLAARLNLPCEIGCSDHSGLFSEESARLARYHFLQVTAAQFGARYVATAHTLDDQAETILHRIVRGTGIAGLVGIRPFRQMLPGISLVRPLLAASRSEILDYLRDIGQEYREDASNRDCRFTRNRIRHELIPLLQQTYNPDVMSAIERLGRLAAEQQQVVDDQVARLMEQSVSRWDGENVAIDCGPLQAARPILIRELFVKIWIDQGWSRQSMGYEQWKRLENLVSPAPATMTLNRQILPGGVIAEREKDRLRLFCEARASGA